MGVGWGSPGTGSPGTGDPGTSGTAGVWVGSGSGITGVWVGSGSGTTGWEPCGASMGRGLRSSLRRIFPSAGPAMRRAASAWRGGGVGLGP